MAVVVRVTPPCDPLPPPKLRSLPLPVTSMDAPSGSVFVPSQVYRATSTWPPAGGVKGEGTVNPTVKELFNSQVEVQLEMAWPAPLVGVAATMNEVPLVW